MYGIPITDTLSDFIDSKKYANSSEIYKEF